jgi:hypothetical protein
MERWQAWLIAVVVVVLWILSILVLAYLLDNRFPNDDP